MVYVVYHIAKDAYYRYTNKNGKAVYTKNVYQARQYTKEDINAMKRAVEHLKKQSEYSFWMFAVVFREVDLARPLLALEVPKWIH